MRTHTVGRVLVLDVAGRLSEVVEDLDLAIQFALAQNPRGVVCDVSRLIEVNATGALRMLASAGRHPRDWPGVPLAVAGLDPQARLALRAKPLGGHLVVSAGLREALSSVLQGASQDIECLHLTAHSAAPRASRDFVSRTLLGWHLRQHIGPAALVVSELVTNAVTHAATDFDVTVAASGRTIRVAVRDHNPDPPVERRHGGAQGRGLTIVAGLSSAWGVLPSAGGGKVVWAMLDAPTSPDQMSSERATANLARSASRLDNAQALTARLVETLSADRGNATSGDLIAEVVRGLVDEHRQGVRPADPASLLLEARRRLDRIDRARATTPTRQVPGAVDHHLDPNSGRLDQ